MFIQDIAQHIYNTIRNRTYRPSVSRHEAHPRQEFQFHGMTYWPNINASETFVRCRGKREQWRCKARKQCPRRLGSAQCTWATRLGKVLHRGKTEVNKPALNALQILAPKNTSNRAIALVSEKELRTVLSTSDCIHQTQLPIVTEVDRSTSPTGRQRH